MTELLAAPGAVDVIAFDAFVVSCSQRLVTEAGRPVRIGSRSFSLLLALLSRPGQVVSYEELVKAAWPDTIVEESSLRVNIAALRKALGDGRSGARYIANVPGRGYSFVATVSHTPAAAGGTRGAERRRPNDNLPRRLNRVIGRSAGIAQLSEQVLLRRLLTISGPGGVGKTTMALAIAERLLPSFADGACFVDLAPARNAAQLTHALAEALGLGTLPEGQWAIVLAHLRERQLLLVLDNCEQVVEAASELAIALLKEASGLRIVATSREPMRAEGEIVHRLAGLELPPDAAPTTAALALEYPAVQLFFERAAASNQGFALTDADAPGLCELCRRLDALPLAIELAAARVDFFGIQGLREQLVGRFQLTTEGLRTKLPRHRTLGALLEWSYALLTEHEQLILQRISVIKGAFGLAAALAASVTDGLTEKDVVSGLSSLASKSLIEVFAHPAPVRYRLLHITAVFAHDKLAASLQLPSVMRAYGDWLRHHAAVALADWDRLAPTVWLAAHGDVINDAWTVMDWAFGPDGDPATAVTLTVAYTQLAYELRRLAEHLHRARQATGLVDRLAPDERPAARLQLDIAIAVLTAQVEGAVAAEAEAVQRVEAQIGTLSDASPLRRAAASCVWASCFLRGDYPAALRRAESLRRRAQDVSAMQDADRMRAQSLHAMGQHEEAARESRRLLQARTVGSRVSGGAGTPLKLAVSMRINLARIAWIEGRPDSGWKLAQQAFEQAGEDIPLARCQALALALVPLAIWSGRYAAAAEWTDRLLGEARLLGSLAWEGWARSYSTVLHLRESGPSAADGAIALGASLQTLGPKQADMMATLLEAAASAEVVARVHAGSVGWCAPEALRAHGELLLARSPQGHAEAARGLFDQAVGIARAQGALAWELRAATSLLRHANTAAQARPARQALGELLARFDEGHASVDVRTAAALLDATAPAGQ
jgi:predicted ATPase/DNA-binding winged helix-turn-helix (wHTH) protein